MKDGEIKNLKNVVRCPKCGGADVVYTCEPKCCFNHVCAECRASFELATKRVEAVPISGRGDVEAPESSEPTVACAACEGLRVYALQDSMLACADCGALLELRYENIAES